MLLVKMSQRTKRQLILTMPTLIFRPRPYWRIAKLVKNPNLAQEGRRDFSNIAKCSQWPHLSKSYEATYALKCLVFEKMSKNRFYEIANGKKSIFLQLRSKNPLF